MTDPVTPPAPAATAPPATPEAPATPPATSLADSIVAPAAATPPTDTPPAAPAAAAPPVTPAPDAKPWFYAENVPATGAPPDWFKVDKYKSVEEQAKAYTELEKRFGAFTGTPKEGDYKINVPEQYKGKVEFDTTDPLFVELSSWAKESQLSQKGYDSIIGMLTEYEMSVAAANAPPSLEDTKKALGENADARIASVAKWAKANLEADQQTALREALLKPSEASVFKVLEAVIAKTRQAPSLKPGPDSPPPVSELDEITRMQAYVDPKTNRRPYVDDSTYRADVERRRREYFAKQQAA